MAAEKYFPFRSVSGDRKYSAEDWAAYFALFLSDGVCYSSADRLKVVVNEGMKVKVMPGAGFIAGRMYMLETDKIIMLDTADGALNRIDRIVLRCDYTSRKITTEVVKGSYSENPTAPALNRNSDIYELALADVYVAAGVIAVTQSNITDQRLNTSLCGIVTGLIDQADTTEIFNQFTAYLEEFKQASEENFDTQLNAWDTEFNTWFAEIRAALEGDIATELADRILKLEDGTTPAGNASKLNDLTAEEFVNNENLLINGYLKDPVNSSGKTTWVMGETINNWKSLNGNGTTAISDDGIVINATTGEYWLTQEIKYELLGKTVTLSCCVNGNIYSKTMTIPTSIPSTLTVIGSILLTGCRARLEHTADGVLRCTFFVTTGQSITIEWVKLELSSVATPFIPPNKEVEKLKCGVMNSVIKTVTSSTTISETLQSLIDSGINKGTFQASGCTDLPSTDWAYGIEFKVFTGNDYEVKAIKRLREVYRRQYSSYQKAWLTEWSKEADGGNANTVNGLHASDFYQKKTNSANNTTADPNTTEVARIRTKHANCPTSDVEYIIDTTFTDSTADTYERRQTAYGTGGNNVVYNRAKAYNGTWTDWEKVVGKTDLANYLPSSGGQIDDFTDNVPLVLNSAAEPSSFLQFKCGNASLGFLGFDVSGVPLWVSGDRASSAVLLHGGNIGNYALPKSGGDVTNHVGAVSGHSILTGDQHHAQVATRPTLASNSLARALLVVNHQASPTLNAALRLRDYDANGAPTDYNVLHTGNSAKVTITDSENDVPDVMEGLWAY